VVSQELQDSIPDRVIDQEAINTFSRMPENDQIQIIQSNVVSIVGFMACAREAGANIMHSVIDSISEISASHKTRAILKELEQKINNYEHE
jgi:hypothetical protein